VINIYDYLIHVLEQNKNIHWLNRPQYASPNKLVQLKMAKASGLSVPHSYVANIYSEKIPHKSLITKPFSNSCSIEYDGKLYNNYTSRISRNCFPKSFFLSYLQEEIRKALELRIFYLKGDCYALSIHSQENSKTSIDYRQYDHSHQNRLEPYELPKALVEKINLFMEKMNIQTGSLDFIYTSDEEFIFLEVNPSGQYDIFNSCNVYPDKLIAEHLINKPI
jgi:glutathione synthase/RimK-type ligase-like ATP-grasp enzyme